VTFGNSSCVQRIRDPGSTPTPPISVFVEAFGGWPVTKPDCSHETSKPCTTEPRMNLQIGKIFGCLFRPSFSSSIQAINGRYCSVLTSCPRGEAVTLHVHRPAPSPRYLTSVRKATMSVSIERCSFLKIRLRHLRHPSFRQLSLKVKILCISNDPPSPP
jgi:hypothetical protein